MRPAPSRASRRAVAAVTLAVTALAVPVVVGPRAPSGAAPGEERVPDDNPDLDAACGIDIHVLLDESSSIRQAAATDDVRTAFRAFVSALRNTGSRLAVSEFGTQARLPLPGAAATTYTTVTDQTIADTFEPYIATGYAPPAIGSGTQYTNWEDAFRVARHLLPRPRADVPHLVLFITDGDPTAVVRQDRVTPEQYRTKVPLTASEVQSGTGSDAALAPAIPNANAVKAQGSHVLAVGVGQALGNPASLSRLVAITGPQVFPNDGDFDISTTDVYREADFSLLEEALREAAFQLCAPSVNVEKVVDIDPDPAVDALVPGDGWALTAEVSPEPAEWVLPADGEGATATAVTGADGFANLQWTTAAPTSSTVTVSEEVHPGFLNDPAATSCTYITPDSPLPAPLPGLTATVGGFSGTVPADAIVTCRLVNRLVPEPAIDLEKATNGADADEPPGPSIPVGEEVTWTYRVTNTGNVPLSGLTVTDDRLGEVACPQTVLAVAEVVTCTATGTAQAGPHDNTGTATAEGAGETVTDVDPSHHTGSRPGLDIEKLVLGEDADDAPGPHLPVGSEVAWTYEVTNTGDTAVTGITVTDVVVTDAGRVVEVDCPATALGPGEGMTCTAGPEAVVPGQHEDLATVSGVSATDPTVPLEDSDPAHHFGEAPAIDLVKAVDGDDADDPPGPSVAVGAPLVWAFTITNTGNVTLAWSLTDPDLAVVCPRVGPLPPGTSTTCFARGTATAGPHVNTATATGTAPSGATVTDDDPAHHFGVEGAILVEKLVEGEDADEPPGPVLPVGSTVTWTYVVANAGNSALTEVEVVDSKEVEVTCPGTALAVGGSMTCTATGTVVEGPHTNVAVARGTTPLGLVVQDEDPANHLGGAPGILVEKATSGMGDLDAPPGPTLAVGERVEWTFVVTNTGNLPLTDVSVVDDRLGAVACPATGLAVGEAMTCTATGTVEEGPHVNTATATGTDETGATLTDEDVSHHLGVVRAIEVTKRVNGLDADEPPGVYVAAGDRVVMSFEVTNPGTVPLLDVELVDDAGLVPTFVGGDDDGDGELDPGEVWTYEADLGPAAPGRLDNVVTVTAHDGAENGVTDSDPAFAGVVPPAPGPRPDPPGAVEGAGGVPGGAVAGGRLPRTGGDVGRLALVGLGLLVLGAALRRGSRSPRPT